MARESITDLIYQYLRALVHAGFRDGAISGLREAFSLPEERDEPPARHGGPRLRLRAHPGSWDTTSPQRTNDRRQASPAPDGQEKRGRGRPRKDGKKDQTGSTPAQEQGGTGT